MKILKMGALLVASLAASNAFAVDGYKDLKFSATIEQVKKSKSCKSGWMDLKQSNAWGCTKFQFGKDLTYGYAFFIDKKLARISIIVPQGKAASVSDGLVEKYGLPSSKPDNVPSVFPPNSQWDIGFDNDTVIYRAAFDAKGNGQTFLMYTTPDFDQHTEKQNKVDVKDDL